MKKISLFIIAFVLLGIVNFVNVLAQSEGINTTTFENDSVVKGVQDLQNVKWKYLGQEWQKIFLKNKVIASIDAALKKFNFLFIFLLAREYSFSLAVLFSFMLWLFTALSLEGYFVFIENNNYRTLAAFAATIALAHLQIFNYLATAAIKLILYRREGWWTAISIVLAVAAVFAYFAINKIFIKMIRKGRERSKEKTREYVSRRLERFQEGVAEGTK